MTLLEAGGVEVRILSGSGSGRLGQGCMHSKMVLIDLKACFLGSRDLTEQAAQVNWEDSVKISGCSEHMKVLWTRFRMMWAEAKKIPVMQSLDLPTQEMQTDMVEPVPCLDLPGAESPEPEISESPERMTRTARSLGFMPSVGFTPSFASHSMGLRSEHSVRLARMTTAPCFQEDLGFRVWTESTLSALGVNPIPESLTDEEARAVLREFPGLVKPTDQVIAWNAESKRPDYQNYLREGRYRDAFVTMVRRMVAQFDPDSHVDHLRDAYLELRQGNMTPYEYRTKFVAACQKI